MPSQTMEMVGMEVTGQAMETGEMAGMQAPVLMGMEETGEAAMERGTEVMGGMLVPEGRVARGEAVEVMEVTTVLLV